LTTKKVQPMGNKGASHGSLAGKGPTGVEEKEYHAEKLEGGLV